jgi:hypothetical protein
MEDRLAPLAARGPLLHVGAQVIVDVRFLDRVELARRFPDRSELRLILAIGATEVGIDYPATAEEAEALIVELARFTRAAPIVSDEDYHLALAQATDIATGRYRAAAVVSIRGEPVIVDRGLVSAGVVSYLADKVAEAANRGLDVELAGGARVPAAVLLLAIAAASPPDLGPLERRLTEYREAQRRRPAPS